MLVAAGVPLVAAQALLSAGVCLVAAQVLVAAGVPLVAECLSPAVGLLPEGAARAPHTAVQNSHTRAVALRDGTGRQG